jgi:hypothetical protein
MARPQLRFEIPPDQENGPACVKGASQSPATTRRSAGAKVLGEIDLNLPSVAEIASTPSPFRKSFGTFADSFVLSPGPINPADPEGSVPWLLTREDALLEPTSQIASCEKKQHEEKTVIICSFDLDRKSSLPTARSTAGANHRSENDMASGYPATAAVEVGTSPHDFLRQKLEEWTNDIECLLPFYDPIEANGNSHASNGKHNGENPITRIRDCCTALAETNTLLQRMAKVAELNSAKSDLDEIETTIETLYALMQVLGRITRAEVTKMRQMADPGSSRTSSRPASQTERRPASPAKTPATQRGNVKKTAYDSVAPRAPLPTRASSVRQSMVPHIDLPGEVISRQKRVAIENKRRQEEEEARKKREFKARPAPHTAGSSNYPRQTLASRARAAMSEHTPVDQQHHGPVVTGNKRYSVSVQPSATGGRPSLANTASSSSQQAPRSRGRDAAVPASEGGGPPSLSRATSSSNGSISGKARSSVSTDDVQHQKLRGKEIFVRDNSFVSEKEKERREREEAARQARLEAAERSRQLSREWAEKQQKAGSNLSKSSA